MALIVVAGVLLSWEGVPEFGVPYGPLGIVGACLCWATDNNLTRKVSASDPLQIACFKGLVAGGVNFGIALFLGQSILGWQPAGMAGIVGFLGYGLSLALYVVALRHVGAARTGAYFSLAPFIGAALAMVLLAEAPSVLFWMAALLMGAGLWLYLTERHGHMHVHEDIVHAHRHVHDEHHRHAHDFPWDGREPHSHLHCHRRMVHAHPHYPDIHHHHRH